MIRPGRACVACGYPSWRGVAAAWYPSFSRRSAWGRSQDASDAGRMRPCECRQGHSGRRGWSAARRWHKSQAIKNPKELNFAWGFSVLVVQGRNRTNRYRWLICWVCVVRLFVDAPKNAPKTKSAPISIRNVLDKRCLVRVGTLRRESMPKAGRCPLAKHIECVEHG